MPKERNIAYNTFQNKKNAMMSLIHPNEERRRKDGGSG